MFTEQNSYISKENFCQRYACSTMIENVTYENTLLALIISHRFSQPGIHFFTPGELSQQLAYMNYAPGKIVPAHVHNPVHRDVFYTQEVLFIKKGKLRVDFYNDRQEYLESRILETGDTILLVTGGHGFEVLEELEMIEVKQGPYMGDRDKTRFDGITAAQARIVEANSRGQRQPVTVPLSHPGHHEIHTR